jgi:O-antigen/teichoic acid export membrane protein
MGWLLGADTLSRAVGQVAIVATARMLGAESYGALAVGLALFGIALVLADFGTGDAAVQRLTARPDGGVVFWRELGLLRVILATPLVVAGLVVLLVADHPAVMTSGLLLAALPFAAILLGRSLSGRITERFHAAAFWTSVLLLCQWLGALAGAIVGRNAIAASTGVLVSLIVASAFAFKRDGWQWPGRGAAFDWLRRGRPFFVTALAVAVYSRGDRIVVAIIDGTSAAGVYAAAYSLVMLAAIGGAAMHAAVLPRLLRENRSGNGSRWKFRAALVGASALPVAVLIGTLSPEIMELVYGESFGGGSVLRALSPLVVLYLVNPFLASCLIALGEQRALARVAISNCALALIVYPIFTLGIGAVGTALASVAVEALGTCLILSRLRRVTRDRTRLRIVEGDKSI